MPKKFITMHYPLVIRKDRPTMEQLIKIMRIGDIDIATKWHELGLVLVDSYSVIREIEANTDRYKNAYISTNSIISKL